MIGITGRKYQATTDGCSTGIIKISTRSRYKMARIKGAL